MSPGLQIAAAALMALGIVSPAGMGTAVGSSNPWEVTPEGTMSDGRPVSEMTWEDLDQIITLDEDGAPLFRAPDESAFTLGQTMSNETYFDSNKPLPQMASEPLLGADGKMWRAVEFERGDFNLRIRFIQESNVVSSIPESESDAGGQEEQAAQEQKDLGEFSVAGGLVSGATLHAEPSKDAEVVYYTNYGANGLMFSEPREVNGELWRALLNPDHDELDHLSPPRVAYVLDSLIEKDELEDESANDTASALAPGTTSGAGTAVPESAIHIAAGGGILAAALVALGGWCIFKRRNPKKETE